MKNLTCKRMLLLAYFIFALNLNALEFTVETRIPGSTSDTKFLISTNGSGYNYAVDCNYDGLTFTSTASELNTDYTCEYGLVGIHTIKIMGDFPEIYFDYNRNKDSKKIVSLNSWGNHAFRTLEYAFFNALNLEINTSDIPHLENVTSMRAAFRGIKAIDSTNLNSWNVSNVENMSSLFSGISSFNSYINDWNVSNVTNMFYMFSETSFNSDISNWDVSKVEDMTLMFSYAIDFNQSIGDWNVSSVTSMNAMFQGAFDFNRDIGNWDVSKVKYMSDMFSSARQFNQDIGGWNLASLEGSLTRIFRDAINFNQDIGDWDVSRITDMNNSFDGADAFNQDLGDWNISLVTHMYNVLKETSLSVSNYDYTLWGWGNPSYPENINMNDVSAHYCDDQYSENLRTKGWTITDLGEDCSFVIVTTPRVTINSGEVDVIDVNANDEGEDTYYTIAGGVDADKFTISSYGELKFINPPNGNHPTDRNADNIYRVQVMAESQSAKDYQTIKVTVLPNDSALLVPTIMYLLN